MEQKMVELFDLIFIEATKWNDVYENDTHIFIFNRITKVAKIKPK